MSSLFMSILRQAFKTFDRANQNLFNANFIHLKELTDQLTYRDICLSQTDLLNDEVFAQEGKAPCTFVQIFEDDLISISVFVLRGGYTMPLHDHPMMHGILRCIYGRLHVQCYTQQIKPNEELVYNRNIREVPVIPDEPRLLTPENECAFLTPRERNFHEITALGTVAAFFDILSPPYDADIPIHGVRRCRFYKKKFVHPLQKFGRKQVRLERIPIPKTYFCDTAYADESVIERTTLCASRAYLDNDNRKREQSDT